MIVLSIIIDTRQNIEVHLSSVGKNDKKHNYVI